MDNSVAPPRTDAPIVFPVERGASVSRHANAAGASTGLLMRILDELDYGLMLVDDRAKVRFANRVALGECASTHCMHLHEGHVRPRLERHHEDFRRALGAARHGRRSMLNFQTEGGMASLAVVPMTEPADPSREPATLLVFSRKQVCEPLTVDFFARQHRLTAAEVSVLRGLCGGMRPSEIARAAGVALSTVRTQIGSLRMKTGAGSIGELVRVVTVLPPIVAVA
ncbi:MAG TPA: helix-turn-helix transcriptional regulator [Albitalea sp.]|uniref:helix-turn-helix transcriptional regulator n=1 Tax=Piscinibacter sp. TaxID=1903157 RepID=UPI002ECFF585